MRSRWRHLLLVILCAALTFGGTFTCFYDSDDDDDFPRPPPPTPTPQQSNPDP